MSEKIGLVVCGNSGVDYMKLDYPVEVLRSTLLLGGKEYTDFIDIDAKTFYDTVVNSPDIDISTAQTSTGKIALTYQKLKDEGYTSLIVVTISSKLSGTYQGANLAKDLVEGLDITVIDSKSVSYGEAYLIEEAIRLIKLQTPYKKIISHLEKIKEDITIYVLVDTLKYLVKNGRVSNLSGMLGQWLKIKPLLRLHKDGVLSPFEKIRTTSKARSRLLEIVFEDIKDKHVKMFIVYTNNVDDALKMKEDILTVYKTLDIEIVPLTPVVGAHAGPGTLAVGYITL